MLHTLPLRFLLTSALILDLTVHPMVLSAQGAPADVPTLTIRTTTHLVVVDVVVTDKKGQPVKGLKPEDFTLEESGKRQKIAVFTPPSDTAAAPAQPLPPGIISNRPEFLRPAGVPTVLLLDAVNSPFRDQAYGRLQMLKYAAEQGNTGHPMAVLTFTDRIHVLQQFTTDPQVLRTAIKNLMPQEPLIRTEIPTVESHGIADAPLRSGGTVNAIAATQAAVQQFEDVTASYNLERQTLLTIDAMKSLSRLLGGFSGRKNVVWLTSSLPFDLQPENRNVSDTELLTALPSQPGNVNINVREASSAAAEQRQLYASQIREAESALATADIAIYPVNLQGLVGGMEGSAAHAGSAYSDTAISDRALAQAANVQLAAGTMEEVAAHTGGKAYVNQNEIKRGIELAVSDDKATYSLAYYPESKKWDGKFRNIKVKVTQGDTQLRYRRGYFALEPGVSKDRNLENDVAAALSITAAATQVSFMAQAKPSDPGKMRVLFLVDAHTVSTEDTNGGKRVNVTLYASVFDANGKNIGTRSTKVDHTFDAATYQQVLDKGLMVPLDMDMPAGAQELRAAALDNKTGYIGTATGPVGQ
jgi:VWFA-related protein